MIEIRNLTYRYAKDRPPALTGIDLTIRSGEYIALIGPNGCGKTTLLRHLNALLLPTSGEISVCGLSVGHGPNRPAIRRCVGMIFQNPDHQIVGTTVEEDVAFGPGNLGLPPAQIRARVDRALAQVGLTGYETRPPHTLSGGQKQLLAMAGVLAMDPRVIVLDEPTSSLDPAGKRVVLSLLQQLHRQGIAIILVTQDMQEAAEAQRILVLDQGRLVGDGAPAQILTQVERLASLGLAPAPLTELMWRLRAGGEDVEAAVFRVQEAVQELVDLLARSRSCQGTPDLAPEGI